MVNLKSVTNTTCSWTQEGTTHIYKKKMTWIKLILLAVLFQFLLKHTYASFENQYACINFGSNTEITLGCNNVEDTYFIIVQVDRYLSNIPCSAGGYYMQDDSTCQETENRKVTSDLRTSCNTKTTCRFTTAYNNKITNCDQLPYMHITIQYICYPLIIGGMSTPIYKTLPVTVTDGNVFHLMNTDYPNWSEFEEIRCDISIPSSKGVVAGFYIYDMETEDDDLNAQYCFVWSINTQEASKCNIKGFFQSFFNTNKGHIAIRQLSAKANSARFFISLMGFDKETNKVVDWPVGTDVTCYLESQSEGLDIQTTTVSEVTEWTAGIDTTSDQRSQSEGLIASLTTVCISYLMSISFALH